MLHNRVLRQVCRYLLAVTVISAALLSSSCSKRDEGLALAETGQKASATLSNMYQTLAKDANDTWELEAFNSALRGIPLTPVAQKSLSAQINALNTRARMAARLSETYGSLKKLASFDASAEVKGSATNLAASLNLPDIPEGPPTSKIAGSLATEIVNWQQSGKLKDGSRLLLKSVQGITDIYKNEIKVYQSFPAERKNKLSVALDELIKAKLVIPYPLLQQVPDSLGLSWTDPENLPGSIEKLLPAFSDIAKARMQNQVFASEEAMDAVSGALSNLAQAHADFETNRPVDITTVLGLIEKAQGYLDRIEEQREQAQKH